MPHEEKHLLCPHHTMAPEWDSLLSNRTTSTARWWRKTAPQDPQHGR